MDTVARDRPRFPLPGDFRDGGQPLPGRSARERRGGRAARRRIGAESAHHVAASLEPPW
ncbi:hypothetical protein [Embleya sp. AB8]|uniref:hypothetical protein n=1 Tax=Embleya sp. AB8 TaxID=3156304 RepID=UPI003C773551